jgi:hypothetical protein
VAPAPGTYPLVLSGDFTGDGWEDLFFYSPSSAPDVLYELNDPDGPDANDLDIYTYSVQGSYRPVVGQFGSNTQTDDIFWYQPGIAPDVIWDFVACLPCTARPGYVRMPMTVNGTYTPVAGTFISGTFRDDIIWYAPGTAADSWWDFRAACYSCTSTYVSRPLTINGSSYQPVVGKFYGPVGTITDDVYWYNPAGAESIWDWGQLEGWPISVTSPSIQVSGSTYKLAVTDLFGDFADDIIFVGPGATQDSIWDFVAPNLLGKGSTPEPLTGAYGTVAGLRGEPNVFARFNPYGSFFAYDATATNGVLFEIDEVTDTGYVYLRYDFDPAPLTELPPAGISPHAAGAAPKSRPWGAPTFVLGG